MWTILAFLFLGLLIGILTGMTAESVTSTLMALLFTFGGGSAIAFVHKLDNKGRKLASQAIVVLSISCLIGIFAGVYITERQLLTPEDYRSSPEISSVEARKLLRSKLISEVNIIDQAYKGGQLSVEQAYEAIYKTVKKSQSDEK